MGRVMHWGVLILFLLLPSSALADGAVAAGFTRSNTIFTSMAVSRSSAENARKRALHDCQQTASRCQIVHEFKDACVATAIFYERKLEIGTGATLEEARANAHDLCPNCVAVQEACDPAPATQVTEPTVIPVPQRQASSGQQQPTRQQSSSGDNWIRLFVVLAFLVGLAWWFRQPLNERWIAYRKKNEPDLWQDVGAKDPAAAERQLRAAWNHLENAVDELKRAKTEDDIDDIIENRLNAASEHILKARGFDDTATIDIQGTRITQPFLAGFLLRTEAACEARLAQRAPFGFIGRRHLRRAADDLELACRYFPDPQNYFNLAQTYAELGNKPSAQVNIRKALDIDPDFTPAVQLEAALPSKKEMWPYPPFFELKIAAAALFGAFTLPALLGLAGWFEPATRHTFYVLGFVPWLAWLGYLTARNKTREWLATLPHTFSHYRKMRNEKRRKEYLNRFHERRWQRTDRTHRWFGT